MASWSKTERQTVELSFIALAGCWQSDSATVADTVTGLMGSMLPDQEILWGPAVHQPEPPLGLPAGLPGEPQRLSDALVFICRDRSTGEYSVVFRGTNTVSATEWLFQDFMVQKQVPWREIQAGPAPEDALVSEGTATAVSLRLGLKPAPGAPGGDRNLAEALIDILERSEGPCLLRFTGHSLGGLLAPVMALALLDRLESEGRYDLEDKLRLEVYGYAGPTPGNKAFADYLVSRLEAQERRGRSVANPAGTGVLRRYAADLDIAPRAWDEASMAALPSLYKPDIGMQIVTKQLYELCMLLSRGKGYAQPGACVTVPSRIVQTKGNLFLLEAAYQHAIPYLDMLEPARKQMIIREVIDPIADSVAVKGLKPIELRSLFEQAP